jgi:hypothetical protein
MVAMAHVVFAALAHFGGRQGVRTLLVESHLSSEDNREQEVGGEAVPSWLPDYDATPVPSYFDGKHECDIAHKRCNTKGPGLQCIEPLCPNVQEFDWDSKDGMEARNGHCSDYDTHKQLPSGDHPIGRTSLTYCMDEAVPLPYPNWVEYDLMQQVSSLEDRNGKGALFVSNCAPDRKKNLESIAAALKRQGIVVDGYGSCEILGTVRKKCPRKTCLKREKLKEYSFYIAFENSQVWDYVTEKILEGFIAGTITIAFGPKNVQLFSPTPNAIINAHDYWGQHDKLVTHLKDMIEHSERFEGLQWKERGPTDQFLALVDFGAVHYACRAVHYVADRCLESQQGSRISVPKGQLPWVRSRGLFRYRYMRKLSVFTVEELHKVVLEALKEVELPWEKQIRDLSDGNKSSGHRLLWKFRSSRPRKVFRVYTVETTPRDAIFGGPTVIDSDKKVLKWASASSWAPLEAVLV